MPNRIQEVEDALCGNLEMQAFMALIHRSPYCKKHFSNSSRPLPSVTRPMRSGTS